MLKRILSTQEMHFWRLRAHILLLFLFVFNFLPHTAVRREE